MSTAMDARVTRVTRGARAARGAAGASIATLLAAASHALAGGETSTVAVVSTAILALPLCTLLAGRIGSLWRLGLAVVAAQFPFHWALSSIGTADVSGSQLASAQLAPHTAHLTTLQGFVPGATAASVDAAMWFGHAVAAIATIVLLHAGERAFLGLVRLVRNALPVAAPVHPAPLHRVPRQTLSSTAIPVLVERLLGRQAITHRGPPAFAF